MLLIDCPECGPRDEIEFHYGGEADVQYPIDPYELSDAEWAEFLFYRGNPRGVFTERWMHSLGCRKWFNAVRDTRTYEFSATYRIGERPPGSVDPALADSAAAIPPSAAPPTAAYLAGATLAGTNPPAANSPSGEDASPADPSAGTSAEGNPR